MKNYSKVFVLGLLFSCGNDKTDELNNDSESKSLIINSINNETSIGYGINVDDGSKLNTCVDINGKVPVPVEGQPARPVVGTPVAFSEFSVKSITSYAEMDSFTNTNVSAEIKTATYGGGFTYDRTEVSNLSSDKAAVGIKTSADYGLWQLENVKLKSEYKKLYEENPVEFFEKCGTEFVSGYRLGQGLSVILSTSARSEYAYEKLNMTANASVNTGTVRGDISASFLNVASSLLKLGSLEVNVKGYGIPSINELTKLVSVQADVTKLAQEISVFMTKMTPDKSMRYALVTSKYPDISYTNTSSVILREHRAEVLKSLYSDYRRLKNDLARVSELVAYSTQLISGWGTLCNYATAETRTCKDYITELTSAKIAIEKSIKTIDTLSRSCAKAKDVSECKTSSAENIIISNMVVKRWEQQYKSQLRTAFLLSTLP